MGAPGQEVREEEAEDCAQSWLWRGTAGAGRGFFWSCQAPGAAGAPVSSILPPLSGWEPGEQRCRQSRRQLRRLQAGAQPKQRSFCSRSCSAPSRRSWHYKHLLGTRWLLWLLGFCLPWQLHGGVRVGGPAQARREQQQGAGACKSRGRAVPSCCSPLLRSQGDDFHACTTPSGGTGSPHCSPGPPIPLPKASSPLQLSQDCLQPAPNPTWLPDSPTSHLSLPSQPG